MEGFAQHHQKKAGDQLDVRIDADYLDRRADNVGRGAYRSGDGAFGQAQANQQVGADQGIPRARLGLGHGQALVASQFVEGLCQFPLVCCVRRIVEIDAGELQSLRAGGLRDAGAVAHHDDAGHAFPCRAHRRRENARILTFGHGDANRRLAGSIHDPVERFHRSVSSRGVVTSEKKPEPR